MQIRGLVRHSVGLVGSWPLSEVCPVAPSLQLRGLSSDSPKSVTLAQRRRGEFPPARDMPTPDVRLYHRAVVVAQDVQGQLRGLVRQLSIDQFENESRRVSMGAGASESTSVRNKTPLFERSFSEPVGGGLVCVWRGWHVRCVMTQLCMPLLAHDVLVASRPMPTAARLHLPQLHTHLPAPPPCRASTRPCCASSSTRGTGRPHPRASSSSRSTRSLSCATRRSTSSRRSPPCCACGVGGQRQRGLRLLAVAGMGPGLAGGACGVVAAALG
jgi:hypothetical protein